MTRDIEDRLTRFISGERNDYDFEPFSVKRLALNMDQIEELNPPPNPTKVKDTRSSDYISRYGASCWELDALEPRMLSQLVSDAVLEVRDEELWDESCAIEDNEKMTLKGISKKLNKERE